MQRIISQLSGRMMLGSQVQKCFGIANGTVSSFLIKLPAPGRDESHGDYGPQDRVFRGALTCPEAPDSHIQDPAALAYSSSVISPFAIMGVRYERGTVVGRAK